MYNYVILSLRLWDTRKSSKTPTSTFQGNSIIMVHYGVDLLRKNASGYNHEPFNCVSSDKSGSLIAAGSDLVGEDAAIYIWYVDTLFYWLSFWWLYRDLRMGRDPIGQFTESHSDDIVAVRTNHYVIGSESPLASIVYAITSYSHKLNESYPPYRYSSSQTPPTPLPQALQ